jgi:hypothetical protein
VAGEDRRHAARRLKLFPGCSASRSAEGAQWCTAVPGSSQIRRVRRSRVCSASLRAALRPVKRRSLWMRQRLDNCLFFRYIRSESNLARKGTAGRLRPADGSECGFQAEAGRPPGQRNRGGAPGGAARPKQAVRASGSSCGARRARSASEWQHSPAWRGHDYGASRRCTPLSLGEIRDRLFAKPGRSGAPRERIDASAFTCVREYRRNAGCESSSPGQTAISAARRRRR